MVAFGLLFYLLRARTHFLGDGYSLLSVLASDQAVIKPRNYGAMTIHYYLATFLGNRSEAAVLSSYQITSIASGLLFIGALILYVKNAFVMNRERLMYVMAMFTGGYMLQFFGYVENYDLLLFTFLLHGLLGVLALNGKIGRTWIALTQVLALLIHIFGVFLFPATAYILVHDTRVSRKLKARSALMKWGLASITVAAAIAAFVYEYLTDYFFRFALVPPILNRLTIEGYTLFSIAHLVDFANLLLMLLPGLACLLVVIKPTDRKTLKDRPFIFLLLSSVCCLGGAFIFDPKLGMARDWDLFAYCGIPLLLTLIGLVYSNPLRLIRTRVILLVVVLQLLSLTPRVLAQVIPDTAISYFKSCILRDYDKSLTSRLVLVEYYKKRNDRSGLAQLTREGWGNLPAVDDSLAKGIALIDEGNTQEAKRILEWVISRRPANADAWSNMGRCYFFLNECDSAVECYRIADALNPYSKICMYNVGQGYYCLNNLDAAEGWFKSSLKYDSLFAPSLTGLAICYRNTGRWELFGQTVTRLAGAPTSDDEFLSNSITQLIKSGKIDYARTALQNAIANGLDTAMARVIISEHPELDN